MLMPQNRKWLIAAAATAGALILGLCACGLAFAVWSRTANLPLTVTRDVEFRGHYVSSFEVSSFTPCVPETQAPGFSGGYWLSSTPESGFYTRYAEVTGVSVSQQPSGKKVYVHFIGDLSPESKNGYGHLNAYAHEVTVTQVLEMSLDGECPQN
jgi:hypothetical protein